MQTEQWVADRAQLQHLLHAHPEWTQKELAAWVGRSLGWVKKWVKRLHEVPEDDSSVLFGLPRGRRKPYPQIDPLVEERILAIRESPPEHLQRVPGPKAILYYLARDAELLEHAVPLPRSTRTIWKVLRRHGCIVRPVRLPPQPMERPAPMSAWQIDFKDASTVPADPHGKQQHVVEILNVVDMGTSIVLASEVHANFHAQTALQAMASILQQQGRPRSITYDRDPRWVGAASGRDFPSAFCRFLWCLGIQTIVCPAHRPDLNAFVERYHRTLKYECLLIHVPETEEQVREVNETFVAHYNQERPNQARSCGNQPPRVAFAELPPLPRVPDVVDPDRWLRVIDGQHFVRKVRHNGTVLIDGVGYYITQSLAGQYIDVCGWVGGRRQASIRDLAPASAMQAGSDQGVTEDGSLFRPLCRTDESTSPLRTTTVGPSPSTGRMNFRDAMCWPNKARSHHFTRDRWLMVPLCCPRASAKAPS